MHVHVHITLPPLPARGCPPNRSPFVTLERERGTRERESTSAAAKAHTRSASSVRVRRAIGAPSSVAPGRTTQNDALVRAFCDLGAHEKRPEKEPRPGGDGTCIANEYEMP